ncbi:hypothetical protein BH09PAT2_BH09PAT2_02260 [soil metagenome]
MYRDELYGDRTQNTVRNFTKRRGSLNIYDLDKLPDDIYEAYMTLLYLQDTGRMFVEPFEFRKYAAAMTEAIGQTADYFHIPEAIRENVRKLHEVIESDDVLKHFDNMGIVSIRTGAPIPTPKVGKEQKDILILVAHPDDAEIMYGAQALHEMVETRSILHYFVLFPGTAGGDDRGFTMESSPILRAVELIAAARKMGIPWVHFFTQGQKNGEIPAFGLREWLGALSLGNSPDASFLLGLALARTLTADEVWGHVANPAIDWHRDHHFGALMADAYAAFGQWVAYMDCIADTRKRIPKSVLRVFGVVWEKIEKLPTTIVTKYYRFYQGDRRKTPVASLIEASLISHKSQHGDNYAEAKLCKERNLGMMSDINNPMRPSNEVAFAEGVTRNVEITLRGAVSRYAKTRLSFIKMFLSDRDLIGEPVEKQFSGLTD